MVVKQGAQSPAAPSIGVTLKRAEQAMMRTKAAALKTVGLSVGQYYALVELDRQPGVTAASLARTCLVTPQAMMILLRGLEEQGLVARHPHPRHANVLEISPTDAGREAVHAGRAVIEPIEASVLCAFTAEEIDELGDLLVRFAGAFENAARKPAADAAS